jgi:hypothetical protein
LPGHATPRGVLGSSARTRRRMLDAGGGWTTDLHTLARRPPPAARRPLGLGPVRRRPGRLGCAPSGWAGR